MISIVMPFWQRQREANANLAHMAGLYPDVDLEIVLVDDGSPEPFAPRHGFPWPVNVIRLPSKDAPKNPCVPLNRGVEAARGEYIVLTSPEIMHRAPLLEQMRAAIDVDQNAYVQAAVWCPDERRWHSHSSVAGTGDTPMPKEACLHFLTMMHRSLWERTGGFDEAYRDGAGYEDNDFVWRLHRAGARFVSRDDLIADHPHKGPRSRWDRSGFGRNRALFTQMMVVNVGITSAKWQSIDGIGEWRAA